MPLLGRRRKRTTRAGQLPQAVHRARSLMRHRSLTGCLQLGCHARASLRLAAAPSCIEFSRASRADTREREVLCERADDDICGGRRHRVAHLPTYAWVPRSCFLLADSAPMFEDEVVRETLQARLLSIA